MHVIVVSSCGQCLCMSVLVFANWLFYLYIYVVNDSLSDGASTKLVKILIVIVVAKDTHCSDKRSVLSQHRVQNFTK